MPLAVAHLPLSVCRLLLCLFLCLPAPAIASSRAADHAAGHAAKHATISASRVTLFHMPAEVTSTHYTVSINGRKTPVVHAASNYYLLNFDTSGPVAVTVTAEDPHFWDRGVEVQPMRLGIRPVRHGASITFPLAGPQKLTISRPGDHFAEADMLFLFANSPETREVTAQTPGVRYYGPGMHNESIDAQSGDTIYLAGGAVVMGSLNIWQVHDVHVFGRGMIIYQGSQNPNDDDGWMHKRNWHAIVMDNAHNIEIDGITTVVRSRTWQIQMKDSRSIGFYNVKVVAGFPNDANQDGMDWLGGGDTTVRNSFFRASDDVFALQGNWEGYGEKNFAIPGHDVTNITIEDTIASTSISNTVRVAWPQKTFNTAHFHMRDMDVIHTGFGSCKVPFAFFELWADPDGVGTHNDYTFADIRMDDWYSLYQIRYPQPYVQSVRFSGVWALDGPGMVPSALKGSVRDVALDDTAATPGQPAEVLAGAAEPLVAAPAVDAGFGYSAGALRPRQRVQFTATGPAAPGRQYRWLFGDGSSAEGRVVEHAFPDAEGTLLDGSGRFRVLLHVTDAAPASGGEGAQAWSSQSVVLASAQPAGGAPAAGGDAGSSFSVPADGGYTFTLLTREPATLAIDGMAPVASPRMRARACGAEEDAVQPVRVSAVLLAGTHHLRVTGANTQFVLWEGPGIARQPLPLAPASAAGAQ